MDNADQLRHAFDADADADADAYADADAGACGATGPGHGRCGGGLFGAPGV
ncbi:hypothetical protein [Streptomyces sp. NPDC005732]|uniref:hypothetical protein n=1 Tax=Streptomyces sp. NPDC005732 TaxID=3157057 RepID=UPI0033E50FDB